MHNSADNRNINRFISKGGIMSGTIENNTKRKIAVVDLTGLTAAQIVSQYNSNYGQNGWRIVQIVALGGKNYILAEKEE